jgi:predicted component of type VI protein secretion system
MSPGLAALEKLLALSEAMFSAAESGDWEMLARREAERRALLDSLPESLADGLSPAAQVRVRTLIEECQRCDAGTRPRVQSRLSDLRVLLRDVQPGA